MKYKTLKSIVIALCTASSFHLDSGHAAEYSQNFTKLGTYKNVGGVLAQRVGPGPTSTSQRYYQNYIYDGNVFDLVVIDPDTGAFQAYPSPAPYQKGAWGLTVGPDNNIYIGTVSSDANKSKAHLIRFDPKTSTLVDLGQPSATETYIWELVVGTDGKIYGCTFPNAKLIRYDVQTGKLEDLGRMDPLEMYARHIEAGSDGYLYIGVGFAINKIVAYNIATGEYKAITPQQYEKGIAGDISKRQDGKVYGTLGGTYFRLENGTATLVSASSVPAAIPTNRFADGRTIAVNLDTGDHTIVVTDPAGTRTEFPFPYVGKEINAFTIAMGPNRTLYASGYIPGHMYSVNPDNGAITKIGKLANGEFYNFLAWGNKVLGAAYYGLQNAPLMIYDPSKPLTDLKKPSTPESNPIFVHYTGDFPDWRPVAMIAGPNNKVYLGSYSGYGKLGGPLVVWDPATNIVENYPALITDQSIFSLTTSGNLIVGSTTVHGGGGAHETQTQAKIFVWDPATKQKTFEATPNPSGRTTTINALTTASNGKIYGSADGKLFSFDINTKKITVTTTSIGPMVNSMKAGPGNLLWGANRNNIYAIEPATGTMIYNIPVPSIVTVGFAIDNKNLYYASGPHIYRFTLPVVLYFTGTLATNGVAYQPNNSWYYSSKSGLHKAWLRGPASANFNLYLLKWNSRYRVWRTVASAAGTSPNEQISYSGTVGYYRWKIQSKTGSGKYDFWMERP